MKKNNGLYLIGFSLLFICWILIFFDKKNLTNSLYNISIFVNDLSKDWVIKPTYTCDWENLMPSVSYNSLPKSAKSLVLMVNEKETGKSLFVWWNYELDDLKTVYYSWWNQNNLWLNSYKLYGWSWICPVQSSTLQEYIFTLYAIDWYILLPKWSDEISVLNKIKNRVVGKWIFSVKYNKNKKEK